MTNRQRILAILNYQDYDRMPVVHFGYWDETLAKWADEGHISRDIAENWKDGSPTDTELNKILGFDMGWSTKHSPITALVPGFESKVLQENADGSRHLLKGDGTVVLEKDGAGSIPSEIDHTLKDRKSWEEFYLPKLQFSEDRILHSRVNVGPEYKRFDQGGLEFLQRDDRDEFTGIYCGSLLGWIRNWFGVVGLSYIVMDDPELLDEVIGTVADVTYRCIEYSLEAGCKYDYAHFWEDICFKNGPLVNPAFFDEKVGPFYKKITDLLKKYGVEIVSLDCDGLIDSLIPTWINNGVNTMFPIEVGTWNASIGPWREKYGREILGVGGMNKVVFARDKAAIDAEIERLKPLVELGGFVPCPDHRIPPDAKWENVQYYCDRMRETF